MFYQLSLNNLICLCLSGYLKFNWPHILCFIKLKSTLIKQIANSILMYFDPWMFYNKEQLKAFFQILLLLYMDILLIITFNGINHKMEKIDFNVTKHIGLLCANFYLCFQFIDILYLFHFFSVSFKLPLKILTLIQPLT